MDSPQKAVTPASVDPRRLAPTLGTRGADGDNTATEAGPDRHRQDDRSQEYQEYPESESDQGHLGLIPHAESSVDPLESLQSVGERTGRQLDPHQDQNER